MIRRPPRSTPLYSSAASDVYKRQDRFPDESDKTGFYSNQTLYTILSDPIDSQPTQNFTPSWLPPDQITVDIYISSPVEAEEASPVLWRGDHVLSRTFQNVRNCELRTTFLLKVLRAARLELGEREPWCTLTDSGIPYTLSILGVEYVFQKPGSDTSDTYCCLLYTSPSPRDGLLSRMPSSA